MKSKFLERLTSGAVFVADGATGSNLTHRGIPAGKSGEAWVLENQFEITRLAADFVNAGADIILTCTFGASRLHLEQLGLADRAEDINRTAVKLARTAGKDESLVAGSIGPTGQMLKPYGALSVEVAEETYAEQAHWMAESGVDLIVIETQFDLGEAGAAVRAVRSVTDLPLVCSFSFDRGTRTMMGVSPARAAQAFAESGVDLLGINCGRSLEDNFIALQELRAATKLPIWFKPNAGLPSVDKDANAFYKTTPEEMAKGVSAWAGAGAQVIGGCCGTSPQHLQAIAAAVHNLK